MQWSRSSQHEQCHQLPVVKLDSAQVELQFQYVTLCFFDSQQVCGVYVPLLLVLESWCNKFCQIFVLSKVD